MAAQPERTLTTKMVPAVWAIGLGAEYRLLQFASDEDRMPWRFSSISARVLWDVGLLVVLLLITAGMTISAYYMGIAEGERRAVKRLTEQAKGEK